MHAYPLSRLMRCILNFPSLQIKQHDTPPGEQKEGEREDGDDHVGSGRRSHRLTRPKRQPRAAKGEEKHGTKAQSAFSKKDHPSAGTLVPTTASRAVPAHRLDALVERVPGKMAVVAKVRW